LEKSRRDPCSAQNGQFWAEIYFFWQLAYFATYMAYQTPNIGFGPKLADSGRQSGIYTCAA